MSDNKTPSEQPETIEVITYSKQPERPRIGTLRMLMRMALGSAVIGRHLDFALLAKGRETLIYVCKYCFQRSSSDFGQVGRGPDQRG